MEQTTARVGLTAVHIDTHNLHGETQELDFIDTFDLGGLQL
jgi:hypothetical protein